MARKQRRIYKVWANMIQRCTNPNNDRYKDYGGRGITVCSEWRNSSAEFEKWAINNGYHESDGRKCTLDRIDNEKGYSPDNCRFVDNVTQCNNKRSNKVYEINGERHTIQEWSRIYNVPDYIIRDRLFKLGWDYVSAITTPRRAIGVF